MTLDLVIRDVRMQGEKKLVDIGIENGKFTLINPHIEEKGRKEISGEGRIISPPLVESHIHLDSALTVGKPWSNESGTLLEAIDIWSHYKKDLSKEALVAQAEEAVKWLIANGVLKIRAHTDSTDPTLQTIEAILEVKE